MGGKGETFFDLTVSPSLLLLKFVLRMRKNDQNYHCWSSKKMANTMMVDKTHPKIVRSRSTSRLKRFNGSQEMMNTMITEASR